MSPPVRIILFIRMVVRTGNLKRTLKDHAIRFANIPFIPPRVANDITDRDNELMKA